MRLISALISNNVVAIVKHNSTGGGSGRSDTRHSNRPLRLLPSGPDRVHNLSPPGRTPLAAIARIDSTLHIAAAHWAPLYLVRRQNDAAAQRILCAPLRKPTDALKPRLATCYNRTRTNPAYLHSRLDQCPRIPPRLTVGTPTQ